MELKSRKLKFKKDGEEYEMNEPSVFRINKMNKRLKEDPNDLDAVFDVLTGCGLPESLLEELTQNEISTLLEGFSPKKN